MPIFAILFGDVVDVLSGCPAGSPPDCLTTKRQQLLLYSLLFVALGVGTFILSFIQNFCFVLAGERLVMRLRYEYFRSLLRQDVEFFDKNKTGELTARLSGDVILIQNGTSDKIGMGLFYCSQMATAVIIAFVYSWNMTLVVLSITPLMVVAGMFQTSMLSKNSVESQALYAKALQITEEVLSGIRTVLSFVRHDYELARFEVAVNEVAKKGVKKGLIQASGFAFSILVTFGAYALAFGYGGTLILAGEITTGVMLTVFICIIFGAFGLGQFAQLSPDFAKAKGAASVIVQTINSMPKVDRNCEGGIRPDSLKGVVEFQNVHFSYPVRQDVPVLCGLSLLCPEGKKIAMVGRSGCGKSTVVSLLERFYVPREGQILIDGVDISQYDLEWLRLQIGLVSQEPILFGTTIEENIRYGKLDATMAQIEDAAKEANAYNFIAGLPDGFKTQVGEKGTQLSGGQKQRIAIARALLKDPKILLLDEATSALDSESELLVQEALDRLMRGRTSIVVAHRLSTIQDSDLIYVISRGTVVESGAHEDLVARQGVYYNLVTRQMELNSGI